MQTFIPETDFSVKVMKVHDGTVIKVRLKYLGEWVS